MKLTLVSWGYDRGCGCCHDASDHHYLAILTPLSPLEIEDGLKRYAKEFPVTWDTKHPDEELFTGFLHSLPEPKLVFEDYGSSTPPEFSGELFSVSIDLSGRREEELYLLNEYLTIAESRKQAAKLAAEERARREETDRVERVEQQRLAEIEHLKRLKAKYPEQA